MGGNAAKERRRAARQNKVIHEGTSSKDEIEIKGQSSVAQPLDSKPPNVTSVGKKKKVSTDKLSHKKDQSKIPISRKSSAGASKYKVSLGRDKPKGIKASKDHRKDASHKHKVKKPKHLSRKMNQTSDPKEMEELLKKEQELKAKKAARADNFKKRVIELVGGLQNFDEDEYNSLMAKGGGKIEKIIEAVKKTHVSVDRDQKQMNLSTDEATDDTIAFSKEMDDTNDAVTQDPSVTIDFSKIIDEANEVRSQARISDDSSSDSGNSLSHEHLLNKRTRGRKHRDRKNATQGQEKEGKEKATNNENATVEAQAINDMIPKSKDISRQDSKRRCIGRKPLTDFRCGIKYTGTVRYVKPNLGVFIDIGCHYDAFCHISRASDDFVDNLDDLYKTGDVLVEKVRIVDIDRSKKRITASLQSDDRIEDELKSARDHQARLEAKAKKRKVNPTDKQTFEKLGNVNTFSPPRVLPLASNVENREETGVGTEMQSEKSLSDLKRERKLQRRAERRKQRESTEGSQ